MNNSQRAVLNYLSIIAQISVMKKYVSISTALVVFIFVIGVAVVNMPQMILAQAAGHHYTITVTGNGVVKVNPDIATVNLSIETRNINREDAKSENTKIVQKLRKVLKEQNIIEQDITTNWFNIYPEYDWSSGQRFLGHKVSNQLSIKVREIKNVGKIIDLSTAAGATVVSGVQFGVEDNSTAYNEALIKAVESAKQKTTILTLAADFDDMRIVSVKETPMGYFGIGRYAAASEMSGCHTAILHNDIEVSATVEVVFAP
ncbi:MAG: SIMPL domain-containing protein [Firmicutes bacterium]|nr:SIMPL domain-containing protein [Bacillota bacterium]